LLVRTVWTFRDPVPSDERLKAHTCTPSKVFGSVNMLDVR